MNMKYYWPLNILFIILAMVVLTLFTFEVIGKQQYFWGTLAVIAYGYVVWSKNDKYRKKYKKAVKAAD